MEFVKEGMRKTRLQQNLAKKKQVSQEVNVSNFFSETNLKSPF